MSSMMSHAWPVVRKYAFNLRDATKTLGNNLQFPLYSMPSSFINELGTSLPLPLLVTLYGADVGGYYSLVWRVLAAPTALIGANVADAVHSRAALYSREDPTRLLWFFYNTTAALLAIGNLPALAIFLFGDTSV